MKQFNLDEYLKNPNRKVVTRDGRNAIIRCTNYRGIFPIVAEIEGLNFSIEFTNEGKYNYVESSIYDLFFVTEKHEGWVNVFKDANDNRHIDDRIFNIKEDAEKEGKCYSGYIATIKIEWEE